MSTDKCSDQKIQEGWIKKKKEEEESTKCCLQETHFRVKDTQIENEGLKKYISCKCNDKKEWVEIFILDKIDFEIGCKERQQKA